MKLFKDYVEQVLRRPFPVPPEEFVPLVLNFTVYTEAQIGPAYDRSHEHGTKWQSRVSGRQYHQAVPYDLFGFSADGKLLWMATIANVTGSIDGDRRVLIRCSVGSL